MGCCWSSIIDILLEIKDLNEHQCNIVLCKENNINGYISYQRETIIENVEKNEEIRELIKIINNIYHNIM